jgi:hypothetical protein
VREEEEAVSSKGTTRIYDAIAEEEEEEMELGRRGKKKVRRESKGKKEVAREDQDMMDNFGDMLKEYLTRESTLY